MDVLPVSHSRCVRTSPHNVIPAKVEPCEIPLFAVPESSLGQSFDQWEKFSLLKGTTSSA